MSALLRFLCRLCGRRPDFGARLDAALRQAGPPVRAEVVQARLTAASQALP